MNVVIILLSVIVNFILYLSFGSLILRKKGKVDSLFLSVVVGFFFYYSLFFFVCIIPMKYYRPLSMLTKIWVPIVLVIVVLSVILNGKQWIRQLNNILVYINNHKASAIVLLILIAVETVLVSCTYNFTLDAAYYVANVATSVETNMMNVYDPFTGAWQDHYELRYFFATFSMQDSVVCQLTGIPALIWTKSVMAITIILLTNAVYLLIARELFINKRNENTTTPDLRIGREAACCVMLAFMLLINLTYYTIYTSSLFLMTRTYEGKAIVGNLALVTIFYLFIRMNDDSIDTRPWLLTFLVCFGATTISSSANMLIPVELTVLFVPMIFRKKCFRAIPKYVACVIPGLVFALAFVLYVKGYFVLYTYPR